MDALSREVILARMSRALRDVIDLSIVGSRAHHYSGAGISEEHILELDARAVWLEELRRRTFPKPAPTVASIAAQVAGTTTLMAFGMFVVGLASTFGGGA